MNCRWTPSRGLEGCMRDVEQYHGCASGWVESQVNRGQFVIHCEMMTCDIGSQTTIAETQDEKKTKTFLKHYICNMFWSIILGKQLIII
eukprot:1044796-Amphidinium_carterae.1